MAMGDLVVVVPSRGRPEAAVGLAEAFGATRTTAHLVFAVDEDDPTRGEYHAALGVYPNGVIDTGGAPATMVRALNAVAVKLATADDPPFAVGFMGDDHRPRTKGWDRAYVDALRELGTGIVYGDDLLQGERLPTQVAMTCDIVRVLGHMCPPTLRHMYVDNYWLDLGGRAGCLRYLPEVVVEHMHPIAGKADWDEGHKRVNAREMYAVDRASYTRWQYMNMPAEVAQVRALREVRT
jgi:hypothetical protein